MLKMNGFLLSQLLSHWFKDWSGQEMKTTTMTMSYSNGGSFSIELTRNVYTNKLYIEFIYLATYFNFFFTSKKLHFNSSMEAYFMMYICSLLKELVTIQDSL